jgi:cytochrome c oxidase subunit II
MHWLPPNGALDGLAIDRLLRSNLTILFWVFAASQLLLVGALLWRGRSGKSDQPSHSRSAAAFLFADLLPLLAITALYVWMIVTSHRLWAERSESMTDPHATRVEITGVQFQWYFRYPGSDGRFGEIRPDLIDAPAGNPLGLNPADPHAADDIVSSILMLPAGRHVEVTLRSIDVIHGLFIPGMRLKQDAIPGMTGHLEFTPTVVGDYPILCTQVCGLGHYRMQARLRVVSPADYDQWLAAREHALAEARP